MGHNMRAGFEHKIRGQVIPSRVGRCAMGMNEKQQYGRQQNRLECVHAHGKDGVGARGHQQPDGPISVQCPTAVRSITRRKQGWTTSSRAGR